MNKQKDFKTLEEKLYEFYENKSEIPASTQNIIKNAFKSRRKHTIGEYIYKVATYIILFIAITSGIVFAKEIINYIYELFTNTNSGIEEAVKNGYIQNVNMDYIYNQNIGIKIDYLVMDESNLDVSFVYDCNNDINEITISEYIIKNENDDVICFDLVEIDKLMSKSRPTFNCTRSNKENLRESILCNSINMPKSKKLYFEIYSVNIKYDNESDFINIKGEWKFNIDLESKIVNHDVTNYENSNNQYIDNFSAILTETGLKIKMDLNTNINLVYVIDNDNIILKNDFGEEYRQLYHEFTDKSIYLEYDLSKYHDNIERLNMYVNFDKDKYIDISLNKK